MPGGGTLAPYLYPGGFIIPTAPLAAGTVYRAHVVVTFGGVQTPHDWSFTTLGSDPQSALTAKHGGLQFGSRSPKAIVVMFTRSGGSVRLRLSPGSWQACGKQPATDTWAGYQGCVAIIVTGTPKLHLGTGRRHGSHVVFALSFSAVLRGRKAMLTTTQLTVRCVAGGCSTTAGRSTTRTIMLKRTTLSFPFPASGHGLRVQLSTGAFQLRDAPWTSAHATASFLAR